MLGGVTYHMIPNYTLYVEAMDRYQMVEIPPGDPQGLGYEVEDMLAKHLGMRDSEGDYRGENRVSLVVVDTQTNDVIGGLAEGWHKGDEQGPDGEEVAVYKADIVMDPAYRGPGMPGLKLAAMIVPRYQSQKAAHGEYTMMRLWVTNPKLCAWLESKFDFHDSTDLGEGHRYLVMY